ncbi:hypothetical protein [Aureimonas populi]|uniref:Uncharacterized protein n=1 Tax=Aureimonas populi TaxID=1701758 RepID=A0ABW5CNQ4_9HYPH|nr:hypothetical protein [Aureimonas populi]
MRVSAANPRAASFLLLAGFILWSAAFVGLYTLLSFGCAYGWEEVALGPVTLQRAALVGAWLLSLAALAALFVAMRRLFTAGDRMSRFLLVAGLALTALAGATTVWNFAMVTVLSTCL